MMWWSKLFSPITIFFVILLVVAYATSSHRGQSDESKQTPLSHLTTPRSTAHGFPTTRSTSCGFSGDTDTYGLGVRLGAYIQWLTSIFAYNLSESEAAAMRAVNSCFQLAMFIGLLYITFQKGADLYAAEAFVVFLLCIGGVCFSYKLSLNWKTSYRHWGRVKPSNVGALFRILLALSTCTYGIWYVFKGLDWMTHTDCSHSGFLFAQVDMYAWPRALLKAIAITSMVITSALVFRSTLAVLRECFDYVKNWTDSDHDQESTNSGVLPKPSWLAICMMLLGLVLLIITVELSIIWNHINDVYEFGSTGQIFPVVVGIMGSLRLIFIAARGLVKGDLRWSRNVT